jgi:hypothetical protein
MLLLITLFDCVLLTVCGRQRQKIVPEIQLLHNRLIDLRPERLR